MPLKNFFISFFIAITLFMLNSSSLLCKDPGVETFTSFGMKEIIENNKTLSRADALKECLADSLRQFIAKNLPKKTFEENDSLLKKRIYDNYELFLQNYKIKEEKEEGGFYKITAEVLINSILLNQKLGEMGLGQDAPVKPSLVMLISDTEILDSKRSESGWWVKSEDKTPVKTAAIHDKLEKKLLSMGFPAMDKSFFISKLEDARVSLARKIIKGDIDTIRKFNLGDLIITGSSTLKLSHLEKTTVSQNLSFTVSVINLRDGSRVSAIQQDYNLNDEMAKLKSAGKNSTADDAIISVIDDFSSDLVESFIVKWYQSGTNTKNISFEISGIFSYNPYREIKELLSEIKPEVVSIKDVTLQKGLLSFKLEIVGQTETLAKKVNRKT